MKWKLVGREGEGREGEMEMVRREDGGGRKERGLEAAKTNCAARFQGRAFI